MKRVFDLLLKNNVGEKTNRDEMIYSLRYQIMMNCWQNESKARPSFIDLTKQLRDMENQHKVRMSLPSDIKRISVTSAECNDNNIIARLLTTLRLRRRLGRDGFKVHFGTVLGDVFPHGGKFVLQNSSQCTLIRISTWSPSEPQSGQ